MSDSSDRTLVKDGENEGMRDHTPMINSDCNRDESRDPLRRSIHRRVIERIGKMGRIEKLCFSRARLAIMMTLSAA